MATPAKPVRKSTSASATKKAPAARKAPAKVANKSTATRKVPAKAKAPSKAVKPKAPAATAELALPKVPRKRSKPNVAADVVERLQGVVAKALDDLKAKDVNEIDVRGRTSVADFIVVASGTSTRHVKSIADEVVRAAKQAGLPPLGVEGQREAEWVLVDLGDIIVHVMLPRTREFYGLERLWSVGGDSEAPLAV